jgi:low affinity Fe/Cu permease
MFRKFAQRTSEITGSAWTFLAAVAVIIIWIITGPAAHYSDTWQLIINTGTTIVTFLMVFLIQNTQNRDARALQLKLDELIRAQTGARNGLVDLETLSDEDLDRLQQQFQRIREHEAAEGDIAGEEQAADVEQLIKDEKSAG